MQYRGPFLLLYVLNQQLGTLLLEAMADAPLSPGEFAVYSTLRLEQPTTPSHLAATLGLKPTTMSSQLAKMDAQGHLDRAPNPRDGRSTVISLTPEGLRVTEACFPSFSKALWSYQRHYAGDEAVLLGRLEAMSTALEQALIEVTQGPAASSA